MYKTTITKSNVELTKAESIRFKNLSDAIAIETYMDGETNKRVKIDKVVNVHVENDKSESKDYDVLVIHDMINDVKVSTGSDSFRSALMDIVDEVGGNAIEIEIISKPSKNYSGRNFYTCAFVDFVEC